MSCNSSEKAESKLVQDELVSKATNSENKGTSSSSSGYSSNRVPLPQLNMTNNNSSNNMDPDSILEADSLEADLILDEHSLEDSIQAIPEPIWPERNQDEATIPKIDKDLNYVADISFKKDDNSNDVLDVSRNGTFVRSIQFKNNWGNQRYI